MHVRSVCSGVLQAIDTLALNLQNKWVFPHCLAFAKEATQSSDCNIRAAGCTVLVVCAEGCCDACTSHLPQVLQVHATTTSTTASVPMQFTSVTSRVSVTVMSIATVTDEDSDNTANTNTSDNDNGDSDGCNCDGNCNI